MITSWDCPMDNVLPIYPMDNRRFATIENGHLNSPKHFGHEIISWWLSSVHKTLSLWQLQSITPEGDSSSFLCENRRRGGGLPPGLPWARKDDCFMNLTNKKRYIMRAYRPGFSAGASSAFPRNLNDSSSAVSSADSPFAASSGFTRFALQNDE